MAKMVEPPILMSRILTFVLATSIVVLLVLVITLAKMIPLERPEVFFLVNHTRNVNVNILPLELNANNNSALLKYEEGFIREYVIARNTISEDITITKNNWKKIVQPWSNEKVFSKFLNTDLYKEYTYGDQPLTMSCNVEFVTPNGAEAILRVNSAVNGEYIVSFRWVCKNISGQTIPKDYKIRIKIQSDLDKKISGTAENLEKLSKNPLGTQVVEYVVLNGEDPLNSDFRQKIFER